MRVAIATTEGPSRVQALAAETAPDVHSVVCVDGGADALGISAAYNRFLRRPTGPVEAAFGHRTFRLDVSAPIAGGSSWQLGVYTAHALLAASRLTLDAAATPETPAVLATGQVNRWGRTGSIDYLSEKLHAARDWLAGLRAHGAPCTVAFPSADAGQIAPELRADLEGLGVRLLPCAGVNDLERALGLTPSSLADHAPPGPVPAAAIPTGGAPAAGPDRTPPATVSKPETAPASGRPARGRPRRAWLAGVAAVGGLLVAAAAWPLWQALPLVQAARAGDYAALAEATAHDWRACPGCALFRAWAAGRKPAPETLHLSATAFRPSDRQTCDQARWSGGRLERREISFAQADTPSRLPATRLCELRYDLVNRGQRAVPAVLALRDSKGRTLANTGQAALRPGGRIELFVDPVRLRAADGPFDLVAYASGFAPGNLARALTLGVDRTSEHGASEQGASDHAGDPRLVAALALIRVSARHDLEPPPETPAQPPSKTSDAPAKPRFQ
jgi:hypothetical protein